MVDPNSPSHQLVGAVLNGRWKLLRLLGEGGMGAVFEADSIRGEGKRAIKLLHPEFSKEEQILQRFFAEAQTTMSLQHQNIARVFESSRAEDGTPYLVMELLQGMPLANWIDAGTPIVPQQAAPIIYGVLQALHVAHQKRVIHRDIKPDNLFMTRDANGQYVVKVLDFGIAKVMDAAGGMGSKTRTGVLLGTPGYMSPEQIKNSKAVDARSDLWAVGIIFYEMLTLRLPFEAENEFARLTAVLTDEVRPIETTAPQLVSWSPFFRRALAKEPNDRFQTAEEMANALLAVSRGGTVSGTAGAPHPGSAQTGNPGVAQTPNPGSVAPPPGSSQQPGKATVAMPMSPPTARPGSATVPSTPAPATFQGAQQAPLPAPPPPGTTSAFTGAQTALAGQPMAPSVQVPMSSMMSPQPQPVTPAPRPAGGTMQSPQYGAMAPQPMGHSGSDTQGRGPTHISAPLPPGMPMPSAAPPNVQIVEAPPLPKGVAVWIVGVVGAACLVVGFLIGYLVGH